MHQQPLISVGIPVYNGASWLVETVDSILAQSVSDLELILCDNASSDDTESVCRELVARDKRIRYTRNEQNIGAPSNYNLCLELARGQYFKWNSASDLCRPQFLERCVEVLENDAGVALSFPGTELLYDDGRLVKVVEDFSLLSDRPSERFEKFVDNIGLNHVMNGVMRREQIASTMLNQAFYSSDLCMMAEVSLLGKFVQVPEFLFIRRNTVETASSLRTGQDLQRYIDPQLKSKMLFQRLKLNRGYFRAVRRAPIDKKEKRALYRYLLRRLRWSRYHLLGDIVLGFKKMFGRA